MTAYVTTLAALAVLAGALTAPSVATDAATPRMIVGDNTMHSDRATMWVNAAADAYVRSDVPGARLGTRKRWYVQRGAAQRRAYLRFRVPVPPDGRRIAAATLVVHASQASRHATLRLYEAIGAWRERSVTWSGQPARAAFLGAAKASADRGVNIDVSAAVPAAGGSRLSLRLEGSRGNSTGFVAREASTRRGPRLRLTTVPADSTDDRVAALLARRDLIYGSEIGAWKTDGGPAVDPVTGIPELVTAAAIPVVRFALYDVFTDQVDPAGDAGTQIRADFDDAIDGIREELEAEPLVKLLPITKDVIGTKGGALFCPPRENLRQNLGYYKSVVQQARGRVRLYESSNEMEYSCWRRWGFSGAGADGVSTLLGRHYAQNMPALKKFARRLGFEIITIGYAGASGGFGWGDSISQPRVENVHEFLVATHDAYLASGKDPDYVPDAVSVHAYPYSGDFGYDAELRDVIAYWDSWAAAIRRDIASVWGPDGADIKLAVTEWNAGDKAWPGFSDERVSEFYRAWLSMLRRNEFWLAVAFAIASNTSEPYDLIRVDGTVTRQYHAFKEVSTADPVR